MAPALTRGSPTIDYWPVRFTRYKIDDGVSLSALLGPGVPICGVYILEFDDGTEYVGQSVDFLSRFAWHRRHQPGKITAVSLAQVCLDGLDQAERAVIQTREHRGAKLRNVDLVGLPLEGAALDLVVDKEVQAEWLVGAENGLLLGERADMPVTPAMERKHKMMRRRSDYADIVQAIASYVGQVIPWPHRTERRFWSVTAMPSTNHTRNHHRVFALSINNVETLVMFEERDGPTEDWRPFWFLNVASDVTLPEPVRRDTVLTSHYTSAGTIQQIWSDEPFKSFPEVVAAARKLAIGLLRKGHGMMSKNHNIMLANDIFAELAVWSDLTPTEAAATPQA
jgi:hypothetical protein